MLKRPENKKTIVFDIKNIQRRAADNVTRPIQTIADLESFLAIWWCRKYNRPYKCAELLEYTVEELIFEYFDTTFRDNPEALAKFLSNAQDEKEIEDEDEAWLKKVMGDGYMSKDEQEKKVDPLRGNIALPDKEEEEPDISYKFDDFV